MHNLNQSFWVLHNKISDKKVNHKWLIKNILIKLFLFKNEKTLCTKSQPSGRQLEVKERTIQFSNKRLRVIATSNWICKCSIYSKYNDLQNNSKLRKVVELIHSFKSADIKLMQVPQVLTLTIK